MYSAITGKPVDNTVAMTGEISIHGEVKPVGGVSSKVEAAIKAGAKKIIIPKENWQDKFEKLDKVKVIPVSNIKTVIKEAVCVGEEDKLFLNIDKSVEFLSAESMTK